MQINRSIFKQHKQHGKISTPWLYERKLLRIKKIYK